MKENESKTQNKPQEKTSGILMKVLNIIINIMIVLVLIVSVLIASMALSSKAGGGISALFGYTIQPIQSDSMKGGSPDGYPSGDFASGDLMIAKSTGFDNAAEYKIGDIVTFRTPDSDGNVMLIVHRIVDVIKKENGIYSYQTQGDNRETSPVPDQIEEKDYIYAADIGSVYYNADYEGKILKGWGKIFDFLQSQRGFFFAVLLPMIIFFMYEMIRVVMNAMNYKKAKADEEKDEAVKAAVAEALAEQHDNETATPENMSPEQMEQFKQFLAMQNAQQQPPDQAEQENVAEETESSDNSEE